MMQKSFTREDGFTLVEVLVALTLLTIGIVGAAAALSTQAGGVSGASNVGLAAIARSNAYSAATTLAQQKLEEMRNLAAQTGGTWPPAGLASSTESSIAGYATFSRTTTVAIDTSLPANIQGTTRKVTVEVFFTPMAETGTAPQTSIKVSTLVAQHPTP